MQAGGEWRGGGRWGLCVCVEGGGGGGEEEAEGGGSITAAPSSAVSHQVPEDSQAE